MLRVILSFVSGAKPIHRAVMMHFKRAILGVLMRDFDGINTPAGDLLVRRRENPPAHVRVRVRKIH